MSAGEPPPLSVQEVTVELGGRTILDRVSLSAGAGEFVALTGPNGAGKTTLLRTVLGFLRATRGRVELAGAPAGQLRPRARARRVAWVPQSEGPGANLPVETYVLFGRYAHLPAFGSESVRDRRRAAEALAAVDLADRADTPLHALSGGERQRALLARALAQDCPLLLLDEPTAHLDMSHQLDLLGRVRELCHSAGKSAVAALHDLNLAARFADRIAVLSHGRLVADGPPPEVLSEELLLEVWGVDAELRQDGRSGLPYLVPSLPRRPAPPTGRLLPARIHVVGGGGSATGLLRALVQAGYPVTAGVTPLFDTDTETAMSLRLPTAVELPFAPIGPEAQAKLVELLQGSRAIVIAPFPVGPGNLANLRAVGEFAERRQVYLLEPPGAAPRDFAGGAARALLDALRRAGARSVGSVDELLSRLAAAGPPGPDGGVSDRDARPPPQEPKGREALG